MLAKIFILAIPLFLAYKGYMLAASLNPVTFERDLLSSNRDPWFYEGFVTSETAFEASALKTFRSSINLTDRSGISHTVWFTPHSTFEKRAIKKGERIILGEGTRVRVTGITRHPFFANEVFENLEILALP